MRGLVIKVRSCSIRIKKTHPLDSPVDVFFICKFIE